MTKTIDIHVPRLFPTLSEQEVLTLEKWFVQEGERVQPKARLFLIEASPGLYEVPTPPTVTKPARITRIFVQEGDQTHLGELLVTLELLDEYTVHQDHISEKS